MTNDKYLRRIEAHMRLDVDLYRGGNSEHPRFDNVRSKDIVKWTDKQTGEVWVEKESGGISTFDCPKPDKIGGGYEQALQYLKSLSLLGIVQIPKRG